MAAKRHEVRVERTGELIADRIVVASSMFQRMRGLLGKSSLPPGEGIWFPRTSSIHMWFMRFPIDVVYVDRELRVKKTVEALKPWRFSGARGSRSTLELAAGALATLDLRIGDLLTLTELSEAEAE